MQAMIVASYFRLDPIKDHEAIVRGMITSAWTFDLVRATEIALLKTFAIPGIARILVNSGEFLNRTQKRYDDTDILLSLFIENGHSSPEGRRAIVRINRMHAAHPISNEQMLYVLSTFVVEPIVWCEAYAHHPLQTLEQEALFQFWINVGLLMGIQELFGSLREMRAFYELYEQQHMVFAPDNARLYQSVLPTVARMMPAGLGRVVPWLLPTILSPRMCAALGIRSRHRFIRAVMQRLLWARAWGARFFPAKATMRARLPRPSYPDGYTDERLGV